MSEPKFDREDESEINKRVPLRSDQVFEIVRRSGEEELSRPTSSLAWSGLAAGLAIGFSVVAEAVIKARLPDTGWGAMVADTGYTVGFLLVILGNLQLFTENTITPVMPIAHAPTRKNFFALGRIWGIVFAANMVGTILFALFIMKSGAVPDKVAADILALGRHAAHGDFLETVARGICAGFLIAALVWILAAIRNGQIVIIFIITYIIAISGFAHVVAGGVEMAALVIEGLKSAGDAIFGFMVPALLGNVIGGTVLFTLITYGQIREELRDD